MRVIAIFMLSSVYFNSFDKTVFPCIFRLRGRTNWLYLRYPSYLRESNMLPINDLLYFRFASTASRFTVAFRGIMCNDARVVSTPWDAGVPPRRRRVSLVLISRDRLLDVIDPLPVLGVSQVWRYAGQHEITVHEVVPGMRHALVVNRVFGSQDTVSGTRRVGDCRLARRPLW